MMYEVMVLNDNPQCTDSKIARTMTTHLKVSVNAVDAFHVNVSLNDTTDSYHCGYTFHNSSDPVAFNVFKSRKSHRSLERPNSEKAP